MPLNISCARPGRPAPSSAKTRLDLQERPGHGLQGHPRGPTHPRQREASRVTGAPVGPPLARARLMGRYCHVAACRHRRAPTRRSSLPIQCEHGSSGFSTGRPWSRWCRELPRGFSRSCRDSLGLRGPSRSGSTVGAGTCGSKRQENGPHATSRWLSPRARRVPSLQAGKTSKTWKDACRCSSRAFPRRGRSSSWQALRMRRTRKCRLRIFRAPRVDAAGARRWSTSRRGTSLVRLARPGSG